METQNNPDSYQGQKGWRTREQKEELILQWQQSGKSRKVFCQEQELNYNSFVSWYKERKDILAETGFSEVKIKSAGIFLFAQLHLPGGIKIDFHQPVPAAYLQLLLRQ